MQSTKNLFEIESYSLDESEIIVYPDHGEPVTFSKTKFENWLLFTDRLNWEMNFSDNGGDHIQQVGTLSLSEYWEMLPASINADLYDYIILKVMNEAEIFKIQEPLQNIFNHFNFIR